MGGTERQRHVQIDSETDRGEERKSEIESPLHLILIMKTKTLRLRALMALLPSLRLDLSVCLCAYTSLRIYTCQPGHSVYLCVLPRVFHCPCGCHPHDLIRVVVVRAVNNTGKKYWAYWQYQYQYLLIKVLAIPIPILFLKSIAIPIPILYQYFSISSCLIL